MLDNYEKFGIVVIVGEGGTKRKRTRVFPHEGGVSHKRVTEAERFSRLS